MILNLVVIAFILAMAYWWSLQGFFSAFLHMIIVIVAGAVAFAAWEPLAFLVMGFQPMIAWGVALILPFLVVLIVLRIVSDRTIRKNVQFPNLVNNILGGVCGAVAGVLTAGITVLGIGFLPLPSSLAGYEPYVIASGGQVTPGGTDLWIGVDDIAGSVFGGLSNGAFSSSAPLATHQPDLASQAVLFRMAKPENSVVAVPGSVSVGKLYVQPAPVEELDPKVALPLGADVLNPANKLVVAETLWNQAPGTYDADGALRIPPTQIRLVTQTRGVGGSKLVLNAPLGYSRTDGDQHVFTPFSAADTIAFGNFNSERLAFVFVVPGEAEPMFLLARHLRLPLPQVDQDLQAMLTTIGAPLPPKEDPAAAAAAGTPAGPSNVGGREGIRAGNVAEVVELTSALPKAISTNFATGLTRNGPLIVEGRTEAGKAPGSLSQNTRIDGIFVPEHQGGVRVKIAQDRAQSILGSARTAAASLQGVWLTDTRGDKYQPIAYVWSKSSGDMVINVDRNAPIQSARQMPVAQMAAGDELFLYFAVPDGREIASYNIGDTTKQEITPPLAVK